MDKFVIGIAGKIGSGKTTVALALSERLGWPRVSFGDYVRTVARQQGLEETRENLQRLGESLLADDPEQFCRAVLAQANWHSGQPLIVEGIRHQLIASLLRRITEQQRFVLIYIAVDEVLRQARLLRRETGDHSSIIQTETHSTEKEVLAFLPHLADLIIEGAEEPAILANHICDELNL